LKKEKNKRIITFLKTGITSPGYDRDVVNIV